MIKLPYGGGCVEFDETGCNILRSNIDELVACENGSEIVKEAMATPIGSPRLSVLAEGKRTCTIIISDHTRPVPSRDIIPNMIAELKDASPDIKISLLVATGCHRKTSDDELRKKLGDELFESCDIIIHDSKDPDSNVTIGTLPSGAPCVVDRAAVDTDLLLAEGFIEPHFFAGFSGGRKSVLPGICDEVTVLGNHCSRFIDSKYARAGILDNNPIHEDMIAAGKMAGLSYIVNVIIDGEKRTAAAFAGDFIAAHRAGCDFLLQYARVSPVKSDIVITSNGGAPLDQNIYQCVKSMYTAEQTCLPGADIIVCGECADGLGGDMFYESLKNCSSPSALYEEFMATDQDKTIPDQWQSQILARILMKHRVFFVTRPELKEMVEDMKMVWAPSVEDAVNMAKLGRENPVVSIIPDGIAIIIC